MTTYERKLFMVKKLGPNESIYVKKIISTDNKEKCKCNLCGKKLCDTELYDIDVENCIVYDNEGNDIAGIGVINSTLCYDCMFKIFNLKED